MQKSEKYIDIILLSFSIFTTFVVIFKNFENIFVPNFVLTLLIMVFFIVTQFLEAKITIRGFVILICGFVVTILSYQDGSTDSGFYFFLVGTALLHYGNWLNKTLKLVVVLLFYGLTVVLCNVLIDFRIKDLLNLIPQYGAYAVLYFVARDSVFKRFKIKKEVELSGVLTAKEYFYLNLVLSGKNYKEISIDNNVSESTVRNMISRGLKKMNIENVNHLFKKSININYKYTDDKISV